MTENQFFKEYHKEINNAFGTKLPFEKDNILTLMAFQMVFDVYPSLNEVIMAWGDEEEVKYSMECGTLVVIDNHYVFFNEVNYDCDKHCLVCSEFNGKELEHLHTLALEQGLL